MGTFKPRCADCRITIQYPALRCVQCVGRQWRLAKKRALEPEDMLELWLRGETFKEIVGKCGLSNMRISQLIQRIVHYDLQRASHVLGTEVRPSSYVANVSEIVSHK